jgi:NAD-specific glutamate dehydrogenase
MRGVAVNERTKQLVLVEYATSKNYCEVGRTFNLPESTVRKIVKENKDDLSVYEQKIHDEIMVQTLEWKEEFMKKAEASIEKAIGLSNQKIELSTVAHEKFEDMLGELISLLKKDKVNATDVTKMITALSSVMNVPLKDLSIFIGTLFDKRALSKGEPTQNTNVSGGVNTTYEYTARIEEIVRTDPEAAELYKQLYRRAASLDKFSGK